MNDLTAWPAETAGNGFLALAATAAYPFVEVFGRPIIRQYAFSPRGWTPGLKLRAAVLADIHACEPWMTISRIDSICRQAMDLEPDIILLLGDYVSSMNLVTGQVHSSEWSKSLSALKAPLGVHAILGNHDYWDDLTYQRDQAATPYVVKALRNAGISTHVNEAIRLEKDGNGFWVAGWEISWRSSLARLSVAGACKALMISMQRSPKSPMMRPSS